jgi:hypothetical protein
MTLLIQEYCEQARRRNRYVVWFIGLSLENQTIVQFREFILSGNWDRLDAIVDQLELVNITCKVLKWLIKDFRFLIRKQKFLECLERNQNAEALLILRKELATLKTKPDELHSMSK